MPGLRVAISQLTDKHLDERASPVQFSKHQDDRLIKQPHGFTIEIDRYKAPEATNDTYSLKRYYIVALLPEELNIADVDAWDAIYSNSIEGRGAPMRTVTFID